MIATLVPAAKGGVPGLGAMGGLPAFVFGLDHGFGHTNPKRKRGN